jgi:hypothetical protein
MTLIFLETALTQLSDDILQSSYADDTGQTCHKALVTAARSLEPCTSANLASMSVAADAFQPEACMQPICDWRCFNETRSEKVGICLSV